MIVLALSILGMCYFSVVTRAVLGGDDRINWISFYTILDIVVLAYLIWRIAKSNQMLYLSIILGVISVNIWRFSDLNAMTSYEALTQRCFLGPLVCLHYYWTWLQNRKKRYILVSVFFLFCSCFTYEIGYLTFFYALVLTFFYDNNGVLNYIKAVLPLFPLLKRIGKR